MAPPWNPRPSGPRQTALPLRQVRTGPSSAWLVPMCWWIFYPTCRNQRLPGAPGRAHNEKKGQPFPLTLTGSTLGPLRVVSASRPVRSSGLYTIHLLTTEGRANGCGWQPTPSKALDLNPDDYQAEHLKYVQCNRCFKKYTFPTGWGEMRPPVPIHSDDDGASTVSSGSLTDDQDDTASEAEQIPAQSLHLAST